MAIQPPVIPRRAEPYILEHWIEAKEEISGKVLYAAPTSNRMTIDASISVHSLSCSCAIRVHDVVRGGDKASCW